MTISLDTLVAQCLKRRDALAARIDEGIVVVPTALEYIRNGHTAFPFRPDSNFYYLTAFPEPEAIAVFLVEGGEITKSILFCRPKDPSRECWDGPRYGIELAKHEFGFDESHDIHGFNDLFLDLLVGHTAIYYPFDMDGNWNDRLMKLLSKRVHRQKPNEILPERLNDLSDHMAALRLIKDDSEILLMRQAADISSKAHRLAMMKARPGCYEYEIEGELIGAFRKAGAYGVAYPSIVASGQTGCILHSVANDRQIQAGEMVLIDAACEWHYYASDITRTWPIDGTMTPAQQELYELVLNAQLAAIEAVQPGKPAHAPHEAVVRILSEGLKAFGLIQESVDTAIEKHLYRRFFMHRTSHWLGLDVHDVGPSICPEAPLPLVAGQILSIEPGLYIPCDEDIPVHFRNIGIRIEDELLVTPTGHDNLTEQTPKTVSELKDIIGQG